MQRGKNLTPVDITAQLTEDWWSASVVNYTIVNWSYYPAAWLRPSTLHTVSARSLADRSRSTTSTSCKHAEAEHCQISLLMWPTAQPAVYSVQCSTCLLLLRVSWLYALVHCASLPSRAQITGNCENGPCTYSDGIYGLDAQISVRICAASRGNPEPTFHTIPLDHRLIRQGSRSRLPVFLLTGHMRGVVGAIKNDPQISKHG